MKGHRDFRMVNPQGWTISRKSYRKRQNRQIKLSEPTSNTRGSSDVRGGVG